uniref:Uncharacterized protein n=1 Tax=Paramoeba aestuarina TaxID=180227 RepID=A0A7S4KVC1_9EUKA|mmetsp:Transcript_26274/g.40951  ORF Transcript_26274/g.40951 Transcript_26274/m.40951 type:complete len:206 (+) Transcript_26274:140-757(+)
MGNKQNKHKAFCSLTEPMQLPQDKINIAVLGGSYTGKTSLCCQYVENKFPENEWDVLSYRKEITFEGQQLILEIVDTFGNEQFTAMRDLFIRESDLILLVYSVDNRTSFDELLRILEQIKLVKHKKFYTNSVMVVGNKKDIPEDKRQPGRSIPTAEGRELAENEEMSFMEVSALTREGVDDMFHNLITFAKDPCYRYHQNVKRAR